MRLRAGCARAAACARGRPALPRETNEKSAKLKVIPLGTTTLSHSPGTNKSKRRGKCRERHATQPAANRKTR